MNIKIPEFRKTLLIGCLFFTSFALATESRYELMETESQIIKFDSSLQRALVANPDL